jgi:hypothetical protein
MFATVGQVRVDTGREDEARKLLEEVVLPRAKGLAGFEGGHWARTLDGNVGHSFLLFDSEANARAAAEQIAQGPPAGAPPNPPATFVSVDVCEVVAQA